MRNCEMQEMQKEFYELYNRFAKRAEEKNRRIREKVTDSKIGFYTKEFLSFLVSECLMEDVETIYKMKRDGYSARYVDSVIRNMCEQVIECLYIMKHPDLLEEYFGGKIKAEWNGTNYFKGMKRTGKARFKKRPEVSKMAIDIGEMKSSKDKMSLYDIYSMKAEFEHNSYFNHWLDVLYSVNNGQEVAEEMDYVYMRYILAVFIQKYDEICVK